MNGLVAPQQSATTTIIDSDRESTTGDLLRLPLSEGGPSLTFGSMLEHYLPTYSRLIIYYNNTRKQTRKQNKQKQAKKPKRMILTAARFVEHETG